jgi:hypothetical protein
MLLLKKSRLPSSSLRSGEQSICRRGGRWWYHRVGTQNSAVSKKQTTFSKIIFLPLFKYPVKTIKIQTQQSRSIFKLSKLLEQK